MGVCCCVHYKEMYDDDAACQQKQEFTTPTTTPHRKYNNKNQDFLYQKYKNTYIRLLRAVAAADFDLRFKFY